MEARSPEMMLKISKSEKNGFNATKMKIDLVTDSQRRKKLAGKPEKEMEHGQAADLGFVSYPFQLPGLLIFLFWANFQKVPMAVWAKTC